MTQRQDATTRRPHGSSPAPTTDFKPDWQSGLTWAEDVGNDGDPYLRRWVLNFGRLGAIRLHHWICSDDLRNLHDHPFSFVTVILRGGYTDVGENKEDHLRTGTIRFRRAEHRHAVKVDDGGCWSLLFTGRHRRKWGFWNEGKFIGVRAYFRRFGHHPCDR